MNPKLAEALETCIKSMEAGASMEECLQQYPDIAIELQGLLTTVKNIELLRVGDITEQQIARSRQALLAHANELGSKNKHSAGATVTNWLVNPLVEVFQSLRRASRHVGRLATALVLAIALIALSGGLIISSAKSLPGDSLYPVKLAVENIKVHLAPSGVVREEYETNYRQQRVAEVQRLIELGRQQKISFEGILTSIDGDTWMVSGVVVEVGEGTSIQDAMEGTDSIQVGTKIEVEGVTDVQGNVIADEIHAREHQILGIVEEIGQRSWKISGTTIYVSNDTQIDAGIKPGDKVTVQVESEDDGMYALAILRPAAPTPGLSNPISTEAYPSVEEETSNDSVEEHELEGAVNAINPDYWIVNGENVSITADTDKDEGIKIGDKVSVKYIVEPNGSFTAIEIEKSDHNTEEEISEGETPEPAGESSGQSITSPNPTGDEEHAASTPDAEVGGTPEPSGDD